jgi:hypothetical protein
MESRRKKRTILVRMSSRHNQWVSIEETTDRDQRNVSVLGESLAVMEVYRTTATIKAGNTCIPVASKLLSHGIRGDDCSRKSGSKVAASHLVANSVFSRHTKIANSSRVVISVIGNAKSRSVAILAQPHNMPQVVEAVSRAGHSTTIHVGANRSSGTQSKFIHTKLMVILRASGFDFPKSQIQSIKSTGTRIQGIDVSSKEGHVRVRGTDRVQAVKRGVRGQNR